MTKFLSQTGERMLPEMKDPFILIEHLHRYALAKQLCTDKIVLDIASGEGYGSNILAGVAAKVTGVDIDPESVAFAAEKYKNPNLTFKQGSAAAIPLDGDSVDVVVSFETLEHHDRHEEMMQEVKRVLKKDGMLIISTPDKRQYSDIPGYKNPYHVKELYCDEFFDLVGKYFSFVTKIGQYSGSMSAFIPINQSSIDNYWNATGDDTNLVIKKGLNPLYLIAIASNSEIRYESISLYDGSFLQRKLDDMREKDFYSSKSYRLGRFLLRPLSWMKQKISR